MNVISRAYSGGRTKVCERRGEKTNHVDKIRIPASGEIRRTGVNFQVLKYKDKGENLLTTSDLLGNTVQKKL